MILKCYYCIKCFWTYGHLWYFCAYFLGHRIWTRTWISRPVTVLLIERGWEMVRCIGLAVSWLLLSRTKEDLQTATGQDKTCQVESTQYHFLEDHGFVNRSLTLARQIRTMSVLYRLSNSVVRQVVRMASRLDSPLSHRTVVYIMTASWWPSMSLACRSFPANFHPPQWYRW